MRIWLATFGLCLLVLWFFITKTSDQQTGLDSTANNPVIQTTATVRAPATTTRSGGPNEPDIAELIESGEATIIEPYFSSSDTDEMASKTDLSVIEKRAKISRAFRLDKKLFYQFVTDAYLKRDLDPETSAAATDELTTFFNENDFGPDGTRLVDCAIDICVVDIFGDSSQAIAFIRQIETNWPSDMGFIPSSRPTHLVGEAHYRLYLFKTTIDP